MVKNLEITKEFIEGINWIQIHRPTLHKQYQGRWIAVYRNKVVAAGKSINSVEKRALGLTRAPLIKIPLVFMEDPHCIYLLK